jgi:regulator of protease activity HflC (stomatin/prohibitin superfamily)
MALFIIGIILGVIGILAIIGAITASNSDTKRTSGIIGVVLILLAIVGIFISSFYRVSQGEAKVVVNYDGTVASQISTPGAGFKAPWQKFVDFDTFSQTATYAGGGDGAPDYTGGKVQGAEVTASVAGGAQANVDLSVTYSLDPAKVTDIYKQFRSQENFTSQIINNQILSTFRDVPSAYTPVEFRGEKRGEATEKATEDLQKKLDKYGVTVQQVAIQDIRYTDTVEESIKNVEVAQQKEEQAQAELRATEVSAQAQVVEAQAQADANGILNSNPLSDTSIQQKYVEALREAGKNGGLIVVPEGSTPILNTGK